MKYFIYIIILFIVFLGGYFLTSKKCICKNVSKKSKRKEESKKKILKLIKEKGKIKNDDVENFLKVSDATVTNYLNELEKEGKVIQHGKTGKYVFYTLR